jgi:hypothetical protein
MRKLLVVVAVIIFSVLFPVNGQAQGQARPNFLDQTFINTIKGEDAKRAFEQVSANSRSVTDYLGRVRFTENIKRLNYNETADQEYPGCFIAAETIRHCLNEGDNYECNYLVQRHRVCHK